MQYFLFNAQHTDNGFDVTCLYFAQTSSRDRADRLILSSDCDREWQMGVHTVGVNMGNATIRSFADLGAIFNHAVNTAKAEPEAANENSGSAANSGAKPVAP